MLTVFQVSTGTKRGYYRLPAMDRIIWAQKYVHFQQCPELCMLHSDRLCALTSNGDRHACTGGTSLSSPWHYRGWKYRGHVQLAGTDLGCLLVDNRIEHWIDYWPHHEQSHHCISELVC